LAWNISEHIGKGPRPRSVRVCSMKSRTRRKEAVAILQARSQPVRRLPERRVPRSAGGYKLSPADCGTRSSADSARRVQSVALRTNSRPAMAASEMELTRAEELEPRRAPHRQESAAVQSESLQLQRRVRIDNKGSKLPGAGPREISSRSSEGPFHCKKTVERKESSAAVLRRR